MLIPVTTPFHGDGRLYGAKLEANVDRYSRTPAAGMQVLSALGEADALSDAEAVEVLRAAIGAAADEKVMVVEVGRPSVFRTLALAEAAASAGYDVVSVRVPERGNAAETAVYLQVIADRSPLPVVLDCGEAVPAAVAGHPRVIGAIARGRAVPSVGGSWEVTVTSVFAAVTARMLRNTGDFVSVASLSGGVAAPVAVGKTLKTRTKKVGFQVLAGSLDGMLAAWGEGAVGAVPWLGAAIPQACCEVWQAFRNGDPELAREKQARVSGVGAALAGVGSRVAAVKYGCDWNAYFGGRGRLPVMPLSGAERAVVEAALEGIRN